MEDRLFTISDVAQLLRVHHKTIRRWISKGTAPPYVRLAGGNYRFWASEVFAWLEQRTERGLTWEQRTNRDD